MSFSSRPGLDKLCQSGLTPPATDYHVIPRRHRIGDVGEIGFSSLKLASSFANAMADVSLTFTVTD